MNTSVTETFEAVLERQTQAFAQLTKILANTKKKGVDNYTVEYLDTRLTMYQETWTQITSFNGYLQAYRKADRTKEDLPYFKAGTMDRMEDAYLDGWSYLREQLAHLRPPITPPAANSSMAFPASMVTRPAHVKLPRIELPKFDGDYTRWKSFESRFNSAVIVNETLTGSERLQYLLSALSGEALESIQHLDVTDANFQIGWTRLKEIYDNERVIVHTLMQKLYSLKSIKLSQLDSLNQFTIHYRNTLEALYKLGRGTKEDHLVYFVSSKFDRELETEWNKTLGDARTYPTYAAMEKFVLEQTAAVKMSNQPTQQLQSSAGPAKPLRQKTNAHVIEESRPSPTCFLCKEAHVPRDCSMFRSLSPLARFETLKSQHACINCLGANHTVSNCPSTNVCRQCGEKHHTLLHRGESRALSRPKTSGYRNHASSVQPSRLDASTTLQTPLSAQAPARPVNSEEIGSNVATHFAEASPNGIQTVLLATAMVKVFAPNGQSRLARALLDQGSQSSFVSTNLVQQLRLQKVRAPISVTGLGGERTSTIDYSVQLQIGSSKQESPALLTRAFIVRGITQYAPPAIQMENYSALFDLALADPEPASKQRIELLLGADIFAQILRPGVRLPSNQGPIAQNTVFGWILSGCINTPENHRVAVTTHHGTITDPLERALTRFWETEAVPETRILTPLEIECERHFEKTYSRDATGRFVVRLPFLKSVPEDFLGDSLRGATASLARLTRKLRENEAVKCEYNAFIREYESLGHMNRLDGIDRSRNYIPHRAVLREESLTTKLRVVFNASSQTSSGYSLNDILLTGPKLQLDITHILLAWRIHKYVLVADIEKMFRQILIHPQDRKYQCILWRSESTGNLETFELNTVTYGTACAPYLSMRVIQEVNKLEGSEYPLASPILRNSVYVDDVFMGAPDKQLLEQTRIQVCQLLSRGGFNLRKWAGNDAESLRNIPAATHSHAVDLRIFNASELKVLGIRWIPSDDTFYFDLQKLAVRKEKMSKRELLSEIATLFDPLGWLSPIVVRAKILMQQQWLERISWDDCVSDDTRETWNLFCMDWRALTAMRVPRWIQYAPDSLEIQLHGFSDASRAAFSCAIYARVTSLTGETHTTLLTAKSRVAPIKTVSIPILELNGAVMLTELAAHVTHSIGIPVTKTVCWTDSTIVLAWLRKHPAAWKTMVANRTSKIHSTLPNAVWRHVPTHYNPADLNSRGVSAEALLSSTLWIEGPSWLKRDEEDWPVQQTYETEEEKCKTAVHNTVTIKDWDALSRFSSWQRLIRVFCHVRRFINTVRKQTSTAPPSFLTVSELRDSEITILRIIQRSSFATEIAAFARNKPLTSGSSLLPLSPFIDQCGVVRVGGRLRNSFLPWETKHPAILPKHHVSDLIIRESHLLSLHGGNQITTYTTRQKYWILGLRNSVRRVIHKCVKCARWRAETATQVMQDLVTSRCRPSPPFSHIGVDYAGPYQVRDAPGRGKRTYKKYIAVFICFATHAVHLELVDDCSTAAFLAAFDRFTSRRGVPQTITSDNGTNFVGASNELARHFVEVTNSPELKNRCSTLLIQWKFYPPGAPHHGGMQEAAVRSTKHHLRRIMGSFASTSEEMSTLLCKVEATLNSRPITRVRDDPECLEILTPGHFLTGSPLISRPVPPVIDEPTTHLSRWQQVQKFHELLWRVWSREYLQELQSRYKWQTEQKDLTVGAVVLLDNPLLPPNKWELGRVVKTFPGKDGHVRVVEVKTASSTYKRPITRVCQLPVNN
ncbi:uncharacterized protein LOC143216229 [Lasioglossum baleicum]|uniref:uncharacterized protein LOC143216229 n=2 Tax=Lasioglossum baleicum TaxID=434251 RepID=UPI003FCE4D14